MNLKENLKENTTGFSFDEPGIGKYVLLNFLNLGIFLAILFLLETKIITQVYRSMAKNTKKQPFSNFNVSQKLCAFKDLKLEIIIFNKK